MIESKEGAKKSFIPQYNKITIIKISLTIVLITTLLIAAYIFLQSNKKTTCNDGSLPGECSKIKPYYCDATKTLIEKASICGCDEVSKQKQETCTTDYQTEPKKLSLKYVLRGKESKINFTVYKGLVDYLDSVPISINYEDSAPARQDFKIRKTYEPQQKSLIRPLVTEIQKITPDEKDQFRIATSIIQNIPFGTSNKTELAFTRFVYHERYPYEVLYDQQGICGEKSELLGLLLKEMGYDVAIFYFDLENHEAVGIKCPLEESLDKSGYCFIETTGPSIMTDNGIVYVDGSTLQSRPEVMQISKGGELGKDMYEYKDAEKLMKINKEINKDANLNPLEYAWFKWLKHKYQLADYYRLR